MIKSALDQASDWLAQYMQSEIELEQLEEVLEAVYQEGKRDCWEEVNDGRDRLVSELVEMRGQLERKDRDLKQARKSEQAAIARNLEVGI